MLVKQGLSQRRSCALVEMARASFEYRAHPRQDKELLQEIRAIARKHKRYGYRRAWALIRRKGKKVNVKRIRRLWKQEDLSLSRRRPRKRTRNGSGVPLKALFPDHVWTYDFMQDATAEGRRLKILTMVDEFTRESVAIRVERRMPACVVVNTLEAVFAERGGPQFLRSDNGPEFIAHGVQEWLTERGIRTHYIEPASPWQNAYGESFNDKLRGECLNMEVFYSLPEAKIVVEAWRQEYNAERPHSSLGYRTPNEFRAAFSFSPALRSLRSLGVRAGERENCCQV